MAQRRPMHLPAIKTSYLLRKARPPNPQPPLQNKPDPVSRPANKQHRPQASLFIIKDDMAEAGAVYKAHLQCPDISVLRKWSGAAPVCILQISWEKPNARHRCAGLCAPHLTRGLSDTSLRYAITSYGIHSFSIHLFINIRVVRGKSQFKVSARGAQPVKTL